MAIFEVFCEIFKKTSLLYIPCTFLCLSHNLFFVLKVSFSIAFICHSLTRCLNMSSSMSYKPLGQYTEHKEN